MTNQGLDEGDSDDDAEDEEDVYQPKKYEYVALNPFKDLYKHSPLIQMSFEFGPSIIPLSAVGMILNYTGNHLLHFIHQHLGRRIFFPMHKVVSVQLMNNGDILTTTVRKEISIILNDQPPATAPATAGGDSPNSEDDAAAAAEPSPETIQNDGPFRIVHHGDTQVTFRSKAIVLSNGGSQSVHPEFFNWFPFMKLRREDLLTSDYCLQKHGFSDLCKRVNQQRKKKIVIIGGSHSGFSTAWMLLNGPADLIRNTHVVPSCQRIYKNSGEFKFPGAPIRSIEGCARCCACHHLGKKQKKGPCKCMCRCYGFFRYSDWGIEKSDLPKFDESDITILYRDRIRVFYSRVQQAQTDGYQDFKQLQFSNKNGFLYSFTGLRGDAKRLYKSIKSGAEKRVRLVKAPTPADQQQYLENADLVVWACGYQTNPIILKDIDSKMVQMSAKVPFTQFDIDARCRIITSDNGLLMKTFGIGLAYPVRTNDGMMLPEAGKSNPRADSFSLYMNYVANTLLSNLLPKSRLMNKNHRTVRLGGKKTIAAQALQQERTMSGAVASGAAARGPQNNSTWVRSGSEQTPAPRSSTLTKPVLTKPMNNNVTGNSSAQQQVNISKVQNNSPTKTPVKSVPPKVVSSLPVKPVPAIVSQPTTTSTQQKPDNACNINKVPTYNDTLIENYQNSPGYLQNNYITEKRRTTKEQTASPQPKKRNWVPSSKMGPTQNKIPKETTKVIESKRMAADILKHQIALTHDGQIISALTTTSDIPTVMIQMQLSENGKAFQAVSQSFSLLKQPISQTIAGRYTLKAHSDLNSGVNFSGAPQVESSPCQPSSGASGLNSYPEFVKHGGNFQAQQTYGLSAQPEVAPVQLERQQIYQTPQKSSTLKGVDASPLSFNMQSTVIDNTPQIQKRKASFKMVNTVVNRQDEIATLNNSVLGDKTYQRTHYQQKTVPCQSLVKSIESQNSVMGVSGIVGFKNSNTLQNVLLSNTNNNQSSQFKPNNQLGSMQYHVVSSLGEPVLKPASSSGVKRHPQTANQSGNLSHHQSPGISKKKQSQSRHVEKGRGAYNFTGQQQLSGTSQGTANRSVAISNQKSSSHIGSKSKRAGTFLKNCKTKFQGAGTEDHSVVKTAAESRGAAAPLSPEKSLSHLASAGQRQIFSDDSESRQSARIQKQLNERSSEMNLGTTSGFKAVRTNKNHLECNLETLDKPNLTENYDSNLVASQTPKNLNHGIQCTNGVNTVQSSHSIKRRTATDQPIVAPLNGNFVKSEVQQQSTSDEIKLRLMPQEANNDNLNDRDFSDLKVLIPCHRQQRSQQVDNASPGANYPGQKLEQNVINIVESGNLSKSRDLNSAAAKTNNIFMKSKGVVEGQTLIAAAQQQQQQIQEIRSPQHTIVASCGASLPQRQQARQKSASRTHRSLSRGKAQIQQVGSNENSEHKVLSSKMKGVENTTAYGQINPIHKATMMTTTTPMPQRSFDSNVNYGSTHHNFILQGANTVGTITSGVNTFQANAPSANYMPVNGVNGMGKQVLVDGQSFAINTRHSIGGGLDQRIISLVNPQQSQNVVPLKVFQLAVGKPEKQKVELVGQQQRHFIHQANNLHTMQQYQQLQHLQQQSMQIHQHQHQQQQLSASPQPASQKKANLTMQMGVGKQGVALMHQSPNQQQHYAQQVSQIARNQILPAQAVQMELTKLQQQSQTQIAQYGLMQVVHGANGQNKAITTVSGAGQHQIIVAGTQTQAFQSRSQQLAQQPFTASNSQQQVVRKPVAAQMQVGMSQQQKIAFRSMPTQFVHNKNQQNPNQQQQAHFSPLKLQQHQKVQLISYSQSQQMGTHKPVNSPALVSERANAPGMSGATAAQVQQMNSPIMLKTKANNIMNVNEHHQSTNRITKPVHPAHQHSVPQQTR